MSKQKMMSILFAIAAFICLGGSTFGQEVTGTIVGTVRDSNGAAVAGATVTITDPSKDNQVVRTVTTNDDGEFTAPNLAISTYDVSVEAANFKKAVSTGLKVDVGQRRNIEIVLAAGNISEVVTVESDAVGVELSTPTVGTVINGDQVRELSLNNRNFVQLVTLAPGVSSDLADQVYVGTVNPEGQANTINLSVNGARSSQNTFTVDGADITDRGSNLTIQAYPSVDSIGEFRVLRSLYPAESGRSGGGQVNVVTRSGTDRFSGNFFEFVRNEAFNANDFFTNQNRAAGVDADGRAKRRPFRYNNFGWTVGGPVYFLNFGERDPSDSFFGKQDKTFFFFSQEWRKDIRYPTLSSTVPSLNQRQGIFSVPICLQATGTTCTDILPAGTALSTRRPINSIAQQYLTFIYNNLPAPNNGVNGLLFPTLNKADFRQEIVKIDHSFTKDWSMYYRYQQDKIPTLDANALFSSGSGLPGVSTTETNSPGKTHTFQTTYVLSPAMIVEGRYNYSYGAILSNNVGLIALANSPIVPAQLPYPVTRDRVPTVQGNGFSAIQSFGPYDNFSNKNNFTGSFTWIFGDHTMKFGAVYSEYRKNENAIAGFNEVLFNTFNTPGATTALIAPGGNTVQQQFANFLIGTNVGFTQASFDYTADLRQKTFEWFAQDEWKFRSNLTLYLGVRYSFFGSPWDKNGRLTNFIPELFSQDAAPLVTGAGNRVFATGKNFCNGLIANTQNYQTGPSSFNCTPTPSPWGKFVIDVPKNDFAPRIGLAWDPFKKGETSIRTGYGIYHEQVLNGNQLQQIGLNPPYQVTCGLLTGVNLSNPVPGGNCAAAAGTLAPNIRGVQADWETPYMQHWSLDVQQQLTDKTIVTAGYYGSKGTNLIGAFELNALPPGFAINRGSTGCAVGASTTPTAPCQIAGTGFFTGAQTRILDQLRPYRGYQSINMVQPRYDSNYHSLQISAQHRFSGASQLNFAYTWSKNLTNNQTDRSTAPQNSYDIESEWGRATLDRRHIFSANYVYELPFFDKRTDFVGTVLGGWQVSGIASYSTGLPLTAVINAALGSFDAAGLGIIPAIIAGPRPNVICDPNEGGRRDQFQWFNTACFTANPPSTATNIQNIPGSAGRGIIFGPSRRRVDLTLTKNIRFNERMRLQLRGEAFNVFNWVSFNTIDVRVNASTFGQVTGVRDPRILQFGAKFYW